jgi:hypothetical protein
MHRYRGEDAGGAKLSSPHKGTTMIQQTRRGFLRDVGAGVVAASVGSSLATDLGFSTAFADDGPERLTFGALEPLVRLMQETAAPQLMSRVVERLRQGTPLREIVAAGALANARTFGGEDYVGFHTLMAIAPAYHMAGELPENRRALPVLKVLFRNASRIQEFGGPTREVLHPVQATAPPANAQGNDALRDAVRRNNRNQAEGIFAALAAGNADAALNNVLHVVEDGAEVHRVVLPYRAWDLMSLIGREHAHTLLRQSVRYCARSESFPQEVQHYAGLRTLIPRLLDDHHLLTRALGTRVVEDRWIEQMCETIFRGTPEQAATAAAAALAEGIDPASLSEAISLAANQLVLRDNGRATDEAPNKPRGSVHGDSIGVHGCDSANAWRNLARVANNRNRVVCLIMGAWQVARDRAQRGGNLLALLPYPREDARELVRKVANNQLLPTLEDAIRNRDQVRAAAVVHRYGAANLPARAVFDVMLKYAVSEDGALHAEKFYRTVTEEFQSTRPAFRWRQLIALARVTASEHGYAAPGHADACRLLAV